MHRDHLVCGSNFLAIMVNTHANFISQNSLLLLRKNPAATQLYKKCLAVCGNSGSLVCFQKKPTIDLIGVKFTEAIISHSTT